MKVVLIAFCAESVTVTVNVKVPVTGGVPVREPPALRLNQVGIPEAVHVYGLVPPVAANWSVYNKPTVAAGSGELVVIASGAPSAGFTTSVNVELAVFSWESVTVTVNVSVPAAGGVPRRAPPVLRPNQVGNPMAVQA